MDVGRIELPLTGFGVAPSTATVELQQLSYRERLQRAGVAFGLGVLVAVIAIPIPLVHFILVPAALVIGMIVALLRMRQDQVIRRAEGRCPFCGSQQSFTIGGRFQLPKKLNCEMCHRQLLLEPTSELPHSPT